MSKAMLRRLAAIGLACAALVSVAPIGAATEQDEAFALRYLLGVKMEPYWSVTSSGERRYDSLAEYQAWSELYNRVRSQAESANDDALRLYLFMGFIAQSRNDAALSETLSSDVYPIFTRRRPAVLHLLSDLPFLVRPTCHYVAAYHGFEDRHAAQRKTAMADAIAAVTAALPPASARACVQELQR